MVAEQPRSAGRRDAERARKGLTEDRLGLVPRRHIDEITRQQFVFVKSRGIGFEPALVFEPALDEVERDLRQPPFRHPVKVFDIDGLIDPHRGVISRMHGKAVTAQHCAFSHHSTIPRGAGLGRASRWADQAKPANRRVISPRYLRWLPRPLAGNRKGAGSLTPPGAQRASPPRRGSAFVRARGSWEFPANGPRRQGG